PLPRSAISSLPVKATPGGSAGSPNDAPGRRLGADCMELVAGGAGAAVEEPRADGRRLGATIAAAAGEHPARMQRTSAASQRDFGAVHFGSS
ncbi:MAG: hypothetical protein ACYDC4_15505, partial [Candidatus Dormibacteria bacterium]